VVAAPPTPIPLFRAEALEAQSARSWGDPAGLMPQSWIAMTALLLTIVGAAAVFLTTASYARKETVRGILRPTDGEVRVFPTTRGGTVRTVAVREGELVEKGAVLATLSTARWSETGTLADEAVLAAMAEEEATLSARLVALDAAAPLDRAALEADARSTAAERVAALAAIDIGRARLVLGQERLEAGRGLAATGYMSLDEVRRREDAMLAQRQANADAEARAAMLAARLNGLNARLEKLPHDATLTRADIESKLASLRQRRAEAESAKGYEVRAAVAGRVTAVQAAEGLSADPQRPLMTITPAGGRLLAELYVPSRAIGFIKRGQDVRLLYDAFPYQRFGVGAGEIEAVSATVLAPAEVTAALKIDEPVYRVVVGLKRESVTAFGAETPLQFGMALTADIVLEQRTFLEWLLDPVFAIRGRA
jgi:membrane fusion protein